MFLKSDLRQRFRPTRDENCQESVGSLVRLPFKNPREQNEVGFNGDNPVFQPLTLGQ